MSKKTKKKQPENENVIISLKNIQTIVMNRVQNFPVSPWHWFIWKVIVSHRISCNFTQDFWLNLQFFFTGWTVFPLKFGNG